MNDTEFLTSIIISGTLSGILTIVFLITHFKPPKKINMFYGYRTTLSMKNERNWNYANKLSTKLLPLATFIYTLVIMLKTILLRYDISFLTDVLLSAFLLLPLVFIPIMIYVETKLKKIDQQNLN